MVEQVIQYVNGIEYNGANREDILAALPPQTVIDYHVELQAAAGDTAVYRFDDGSGLQTYTLAVGDWLIWSYGPPQSLPAAAFASSYVKRSDLP